MNIVCYHANCNDGTAAALSAWLKLGDTDTRYIPVQYGHPPPWSDDSDCDISPADLKGATIYILDFSYSAEIIHRAAAAADRIIIIDHHIDGPVPAMRKRPIADNVTIEFDVHQSGAVLAWKHFHPLETRPLLFCYIQDRDLWTKLHHLTNTIAAALPVYSDDWRHWKHLILDPSSITRDLIGLGTGILRDRARRVEALVASNTLAESTPVTHDFCGFRVPVINASPDIGSELGHTMLATFPSIPFCVSYFDCTHEGVRVYQLRSVDERTAVGPIAKRNEGGGHRNAASFSVPLHPSACTYP